MMAGMMKRTDMRGFTLIEILVAIVIISLLLTTVFGVFSSVSGTQERLEREAGEHHLARVLLDRIGRELRGAYLSNNRQTLFAAGNEEGRPTLTFTTTTDTPYGDTRAGLAIVRYRLEGAVPEAETGLTLLRGERQLFSEHEEFAREHRLTDTLRKFELRYYDRGRWDTEWPAEKRALPQLVEVTLTLGSAAAETVFRTACELPATRRSP